MDDTKKQPTLMAIKSARVLFGGPVVTFWAFKQSGPHALREIANSEFVTAIKSLEESGVGKVCTVQVWYASNPVTVFIKEEPHKVDWPTDLCSQSDYRSKYC